MKNPFKKKAKTEEENQAKRVKTKRTFTSRFYMMILSGVTFIVGGILFGIYVGNLNMAIGGPATIMMVVSIFAFRYYWKKEDSLTVDHIGEAKKKESFNSLNLYRDKVEFANVYQPEGFPMVCENDGKKYYVNIEEKEKLVPFVLPDQQFYDPVVFAQRVLGLPAHRKIFERKPKLMQQLKTAFLVLAIGIMWLLILTTTGG